MDKDKIYGVILGHALGDALGSPVELFPFTHYSDNLNTPITKYNRTYGKQISVLGQVSDDTELAIVLTKTIISGYTKEKAVINYMLWANNNNFENCKGNASFYWKKYNKFIYCPKFYI